MAKKRSKATPQKKQPARRAGSQRKRFNSSSVITNSFSKGMNKDIAQSLELNTQWWHARNAANNDADGDVGLLGNEPANLQCGVIPYTIIGAIHRYGDEWVVYSTDNINSEIGRFDDSECKYTTIVNDTCLNFKQKNLITGAAKENFDCTWQVYWDDGLNPSRTLNIDDVPYLQEITSAPGDACIVYSNIEPLQLDCEEIRLAPLVSTPCVKLSKAKDGGMLEDGCYQAYIAYTENEQRVTDYIGISNLQTIWNHDDNSCGLDINISELDIRYDAFQLTLLIRNQGQLFRKIIGQYSTEISSINIDFIDPSLVSETAENLFFISPSYEKSESMFVVDDWLIRQGPTEQFDFNYQPLANDIETHFVVNSVPSTYYHKAGNKLGYMRDEQYAFFIRWIYNTGEKSSSYHIPGRAPQPYTLPNGLTYNEDELIVSSNSINVLGDEEYVFKVYNTGTVTQGGLSEQQDDGTSVIARGDMGYWQSTERYPSNRPDIWGDLCGEFIRHHKMPSEQLGGNQLHLNSPGEEFLNILGVEFSNIARPIYNDGTYIENVVGYEILRGSRLGAKSILAKGMFKNMRKYTVPDNDNLIGGDIQGLYPNYPYNDLRPDIYFTSSEQTEGCDGGVSVSINEYPALSGYTQDVFSFHSPELMFTRPFLNANETKIYGEIHGNSSGKFIPSEQHPGQKLLRNISSVIAGIIGLGYAIRQIQGTPSLSALPVQAINNAYPEWKIKINDIEGKAQEGGQSTTVITVPPAVVTQTTSPRSGGEISGGGTEGIDYPINSNNNKEGQNVIIDGESTELTASTGAWKNIQSYVDSVTGEDGSNSDDDSDSWWSSVIDFITGTVEQLQDLIPDANIDETLNTLAMENIKKTKEFGDGFMGGGIQNSVVKDSPDSNLPAVVKTITNFMLLQKNIAIGGQEIIDLFYNLVSFEQYALKYNSHGFYNNFIPKAIGDRFRSNNLASNYLGSSFQTFDDNKYKVNNLYRPDTVAISTGNEFDIPSIEDTSRFVLGGFVTESSNGTQNGNGDNSTNRLLNPQGPFKEPISALYGALKFNIDNQYGQLDGIKQIQMRGCVEKLDPLLPEEYLYSTKPIFSGDVFVSRYTEKHIMPIFTDFMMGQYDGFPYDYRLRVNIPYPRYWMDTRKFDIGQLAQAISTIGLSTLGNPADILPNDLFYLDRGNSCNVITNFATQFIGGDEKLNNTYSMVHAYMYTHVNGVNDFYVESEINLPYRDWEEPKERRFYDIYKYNNLDDLFHAEIQRIDNFYKYDESLSPSKFQSQIFTFGTIQSRDYDPLVADTCFTKYPKRLIYSLQAQNELKKNFWRVFLPYNYKDFKGVVSVIKPFSKNGAVVFFPYLSPQLFSGVDQIKTMSDNKLTIGDGGLFSQPMQNITNSDVSNEYGSCESLRSVINTPMGLFFISQAQGKIFQYIPGKGIAPISNQGMKYWFNEYLPSSLIRQFPELEESPLGDNPVAGVGCQAIYDPNDDIAYFMKRDYKVKSEHISKITYTEATGFMLNNSISLTIGDPIYFDDCSWTISYDPKSSAWISFHDWHPELALPSINHFFTTKTIQTSATQCPPGYNYNPTTGLCEQGSIELLPADVSVTETAATITGGAEGCLLDIVIAMDVSTSIFDSYSGLEDGVVDTIDPEYTPLAIDAQGNAIPGSNQIISNNAASAQLAFLDEFLNDPLIRDPWYSGKMQIGFTKWSTSGLHMPQNPDGSGPYSMSGGEFSSTAAEIINWYNPNNTFQGMQESTGGQTNLLNGMGTDNPFQAPFTGGTQGALGLLNAKSNSQLSSEYPNRAQDPTFRQMLIVISDGTTGEAVPAASVVASYQSSNVCGVAAPCTPANPSAGPNTGSWAAGQAFLDNRSTAQELYGVFVGRDATAVPDNTIILNAITNTTYNTSTNATGKNQFALDAQDSASLQTVAANLAGDLCGEPYVCTCPTGFTKVFFNPASGEYDSLSSATDSLENAIQNETPPICRRVVCTCEKQCDDDPVQGNCPDSAPDFYSIGNPNWVNPNPPLCNCNDLVTTPPNNRVSSFWRHNDRCDLFANFYGKDYPWEIDLISNTGQAVNTIRSIEYQLETYVSKGTLPNSCGGDTWEDLNFNFDQATIYNNEQVSGLLLLNMAPYNNPWNQLNYPVIGTQSIDVLVAKVEQKFRLNQFWDITNDRGEFSNAEQPVWSTSCNGYIRTLNSINLNYNKPETQRKKFRHYSNHVLLRRRTSGNRKMLLRLNNTKLNLSMR